MIKDSVLSTADIRLNLKDAMCVARLRYRPADLCSKYTLTDDQLDMILDLGEEKMQHWGVYEYMMFAIELFQAVQQESRDPLTAILKVKGFLTEAD